jgi:hypothetical protein
MFIVFVNRDNIQIFVTLVIIKHVECRTLGPFKLPHADPFAYRRPPQTQILLGSLLKGSALRRPDLRENVVTSDAEGRFGAGCRSLCVRG